MIPAAFPGIRHAEPPVPGATSAFVEPPGGETFHRRAKGDSYPVDFPRAAGWGVHVVVAGVDGARSVAMSRRISPNRWREMATSAI